VRELGDHPEQPALHFFDQTISKGQLLRCAAGFAAALTASGVRGGDRVALYLQNVPEFVVALLGIWRMGAIAVPVNPMNKQRELQLILDDSDACALVCMADLVSVVESVREPIDVSRRFVVHTSDRLPLTESDADGPGIEPPLVGEDETEFWSEVRAGLTAAAEPDAGLVWGDPACLTYTSGTTGPPKGAVNTHQKMLFSSRTFERWMELDEEDVILGIAPFFHITGLVGHVTTALVSGAALVVLGRFSAEVAVTQACRHRATFSVGAITAFQAMMDSPATDAAMLQSLTKIYSGGGPVPPALTAAFERSFGTYVHPIYGLTESTSPAISTPSHARAPVDPATGALAIGVPVYNTVVKIVDDDGRETPVGAVGEIAIRGPQVIDGYWNNPEESANAIREGWLYTGDIGYMDAAGWFYLIDRKKDLIIASGYKIWPREVEDVLYEHPAVREAAVIGVPDSYRGETVRAFVSLGSQDEVEASDLIAFCKERMAAYKYPREVVILPELPKTSSGKILRRSLR
jgi:long-chain acyl-CoA synthetase